jgi:hypothetical protein
MPQLLVENDTDGQLELVMKKAAHKLTVCYHMLSTAAGSSVGWPRK